MIVDTSAIIALLLLEPESDEIRRCLVAANNLRISAGTLLETNIVAHGYGVSDKLDDFISEFALEVVPLEKDHIDAAFEGFRRYGKGLHPARLNFGDCFSYGLAKTLQEPLLFKGNDFSQTDIISAV